MTKDLIIEPTNLWDFPKQSYGKNPKGNRKFNGVTPAGVIYNMIKRYTNEGDLVVDPMCGSGTTIDVCKEENKVIAWVIGDHWRSNSGFISVGIKVYHMLEKYFKPLDIVCLARRNQTSNTPLWKQRAIKNNFYLRGFKYLFIMKK